MAGIINQKGVVRQIDNSRSGASSSKVVVPNQSVKGKKPFGTYNFPRRGGK